MIGLIGEIKDIYSIVDRIHNIFPKIMIYVFFVIIILVII